MTNSTNPESGSAEPEDALEAIIGTVEGLPSDAAAEHDRDLYGDSAPPDGEPSDSDDAG